MTTFERSKSLWAQYKFERQGIETLECDRGFIAYQHMADKGYLFVCEYFVHPDARKSRLAWELYQALVDEARLLQCKRIVGCVWPGTPGSEEALIIALKAGFKLEPVQDGSVTYSKEVDHG